MPGPVRQELSRRAVSCRGSWETARAGSLGAIRLAGTAGILTTAVTTC